MCPSQVRQAKPYKVDIFVENLNYKYVLRVPVYLKLFILGN